MMVLMDHSKSDQTFEEKTLCVIQSIMEELARAIDEDDLIGRLTERTRHILDSGSAFFYTVSDPGRPLVLKQTHGTEADVLDNAMAERVLACRQTQIVNQKTPAPCKNSPPGQWRDRLIRNQLATPVQHAVRIMAVLMVRDILSGGEYGSYEARLLEIIARHAAALIHNQRLIAANRSVEQLARLGASLAEMTHALKNKLSLWEGAVKLVDRQMPAFGDPARDEVWQMQVRAAQSISRLVRGILNIAAPEPEAGKPTDINVLLRELFQCYQAQAGEVGVRISFTPDPALPTRSIPAEHLADAVANLIDNGLDAVRESKQADRQVALFTRFDPLAQKILILVEDNGPGIPHEMHDQIFSQGFTTKGSRGTGLGLLMTHRKITGLGGTIQFDSRPGVGTTFRISLPVASESPTK